MKNFIEDGKTIEWTNSTGSSVASGQPVIVGNIVAVAMGVIADGETGVLKRSGVFSFTKDTPLVINQGDSVFWSTTNKEVTKTITDQYIGKAFKGAVSAATEVQVQIEDSGGEIPVAAVVADVSTANGSDPATTQALANALKVTVNQILTSLKDSSLMASA